MEAQEKKDKFSLKCMKTSNKSLSEDETDFPPNGYIFRKRDALFLIVGIGTYITDWVFDLLTAYNHWKHGNLSYFYFTIGFIVAPSLLVTLISLWWYRLDSISNSRPKGNNYFQQRFFRIMFHIFQFAPILRYIDCLIYGFSSRMAWKKGESECQRQMYTLMLHEDADCVLLRLIESFTEAIPQLMLQLYILLQYKTFLNNPIWDKMLWLSCLSSLVSVAWGVTAYFRDSRFTDVNKNNISFKGSMVLLSWQFFSIGSRVLALVIFSTLVKLWLLTLCFAHWLIMFIWLIERKSFSQIASRAYQLFLSIIFAAVYVFAFVNDKDEPTQRTYAAFYTLFAAENLAMMTFWLIYGDVTLWYYFSGVIIHYVCFVLALTLMILYYARFHPTQSQGKMNRSSHLSPSSLTVPLENNRRSSSPSILERNPNLQFHLENECENLENGLNKSIETQPAPLSSSALKNVSSSSQNSSNYSAQAQMNGPNVM